MDGQIALYQLLAEVLDELKGIRVLLERRLSDPPKVDDDQYKAGFAALNAKRFNDGPDPSNKG